MTSQRIRGPEAKAVLRLVIDRQPVPSVSFANIRHGAWGTFPFANYDCRLSLRDDGALRLLCEAGKKGDPFRDQRDASGIDLNSPSRFELADGSELVADATNPVQWGGLPSPKGTILGLDLDLHAWTWTTKTRPIVWIGRLLGASFRRGNLLVGTTTGSWHEFNWSNLHVRGQANWQIIAVPGEPHPVAVVTRTDRDIDPTIVGNDLFALAFSLGQPLELTDLVGVDGDFNPVGAIGLHLGGHRGGGKRPPVPQGLDFGIHWTAELFTMVAEALGRPSGDRLDVALGAYLDGVTSHLDLGYLSVQIALEAFATVIAGASAKGNNSLVSDVGAWNAWVDGARKAIVGHLPLGDDGKVDEASAEKVIGKVRSAHFPPTTDRVEAALRHVGLTVPSSVVKEIGKRNRVAHTFSMSSPGSRDLQEDVVRLHLVQALLAALVAKHVGYQGPIVGPERDPQGRPIRPAWWPHSGEGATPKTYRITREAGEPRARRSSPPR